jgi:Ca-activated chloride channel homolog
MTRLAILAPLVLLASFGVPQQTTFRGGVQTVALYATVLDRAGRLVPDLQRQHFEVFDDGKLQPLTVFKSDVQPITVVVMLDTSGSMTENIDLLKQAAEQFVIRLLPADKARIGSFSDKIIISPAFTGNRDQLIDILHNDIQYGNPTFLWDAIDEAMDALADQTGRRVVLVFTDGYDETSQHATFDSVMHRAETENFMIYAIGFHSFILGHTTQPDPGLKKLAGETGGGYFELSRAADLGDTFTRVADELHRQYVLGFSPSVLDGKVHKLDVRVKLPGMTVRARQSYVASKGSGT